LYQPKQCTKKQGQIALFDPPHNRKNPAITAWDVQKPVNNGGKLPTSTGDRRISSINSMGNWMIPEKKNLGGLPVTRVVGLNEGCERLKRELPSVPCHPLVTLFACFELWLVGPRK